MFLIGCRAVVACRGVGQALETIDLGLSMAVSGAAGDQIKLAVVVDVVNRD